MQLIEKQISPVDIQSRRDIAIRPGDNVRVHQKIVEKNKSRIQIFEGIVIATKHGNEPGSTFTVRRVGSDGVAVEKIYPLYSPMIDAIEITRRAKMRRSRLYFLRGKTPKQVREKLRRALSVSEKTTIESNRIKEDEILPDKDEVNEEKIESDISKSIDSSEKDLKQESKNVETKSDNKTNEGETAEKATDKKISLEANPENKSGKSNEK